VYSTAALAALSVLFDVVFVAIEAVSFGPLALIFLLLFPLPTVPPALIAVPVLILTISVMVDDRRLKRAAAPAPAPVHTDPT
jgi:hypothetical protein